MALAKLTRQAEQSPPPTVSHWLIDKIIYRTGDYAIG